ncbi:MAG: hypothetical protein AAGD43_02555 [Pseudomonadota bacterium]
MIIVRDVFYASDWNDESPGVAGDLARVASQLTEGVEHEPGVWLVEPQDIPSDHDGFKIRYHYVAVPRADGVYQIPAELPCEPHAIAYGEGLGWSPDMMVFDREEARVMLDEIGDQEVEYLVCAEDDVPGVIELRDGPVATFRPAH